MKMKMKFITETLAATVVLAAGLAFFGMFVHGTVACLHHGVTLTHAAMAVIGLVSTVGIGIWVSSRDTSTEDTPVHETSVASKAQATGII